MYQIGDDIADATGSRAKTGKNAGRDRSLGKATYVTVLGLEAAQARLAAAARTAAAALASVDGDTGRLRGICSIRIDAACPLKNRDALK